MLGAPSLGSVASPCCLESKLCHGQRWEDGVGNSGAFGREEGPGPEASVQARVPVQVTKNRPLVTCTAYPGLLERGHGLRQGSGPPTLGASGCISLI